MPTETLYEGTGLRIHRNDKNGFTVCRLHYTADPAKRTESWKKEASAGMPPPKWAMEYEIEYTALFGQKVFPEIITNRDKIIVRPPYPEFPGSQTCWGGLDYGARNPSSFHVYTISDGVAYSVWELFEPCRSIPEFVAKMKDCPYWAQIRYIAADPSLWYLNQRNRFGAACSTYDLFLEGGVTKLLKGATDEQAWLALMRAHWSGPGREDDPTFRIFDCCANQIREFETAVFASMSDRLLMTNNYREAIQDHDNHALDDCKYWMNSRPRVVKKGLTLPNMAGWYSSGGRPRELPPARPPAVNYGRRVL